MSELQKEEQLKAETGFGEADIKEALTASAYHVDRAREYLRNRTRTKVAEVTSVLGMPEGYIGTSSSADGKNVAVVSLRCETKGCSESQEFRDMANLIAAQIVSLGNPSLQEIEQSISLSHNGTTVGQLLDGLRGKTAERVGIESYRHLKI